MSIAVRFGSAVRIGCVVAESFARTFYRDCFGVGLPAIEVPGIKDLVNRGDVLPVDLTAGGVVNTTTGARATESPADPFLIDMLEAGGLIALAAKRPELFGTG